MPDLTERWVASQNTDVGGWQVRTASGGPVADMVLTEEYARRIADLHNAAGGGRDLTATEIVARVLHASGLISEWDDLYEDAAADVAEALRAAGRLLPEGGETRTEWAAMDDWPRVAG